MKLPPGSWVLTASAPGYIENSVTVELGEKDLDGLEIPLFRVPQFTESVEVFAEKPPPERPATVPIEPERVLEVAGSIDNVFRTLQTLPGVAAAEDIGSRLSVRGGSPDQNLTIMDGIEVHNPYRLFGLTSAFNPETVESFELTAGGFSAKYGDRLSSLLVVKNREGNGEVSIGGSTSVSITDANIILEGKLPGTTPGAWLVTARRTYYDLVAERFVDGNLPSFGDLQAKFSWEFKGGQRLAFFGLRSRENTDFSIDSDTPGEFGDILAEAGNDLASVSFRTPLGAKMTSETIFAWYRNLDSFGFDGRIEQEAERSNSPEEGFGFTNIIFDRQLYVRDLSLREEVSIDASERHFVETGIELHRLRTGVQFESEGDRNVEEANGSSVRGGAGLPDSLDSSLPASRVGMWLQDQISLGSRLTIEPGLRFDWSNVNGNTTLSPRLAATVSLNDETRLNGAFGLYTQSPGYEKLLQSDYFVDLTDARRLDLVHECSVHTILGLEHDLAPGLTARVEAFYKTFDDIIVGRLETDEERLARVSRYDFPPELWDSVPTAPIITSNPTNQAGGRAYGLDLYVARRGTRNDRVTGWLAYTWSRAKRDAYDNLYPFDYDRPHALNLVGELRLSAKLRLAATARVASGFPYTPVLGVRVAAREDPNDPDRLIPATDPQGLLVYTVDLGDVSNLNRARLPVYGRIDARLTYRPGGDDGRFGFYLEVINVFNRKNAINMEPTLEYDPTSDVPKVVENPSEAFPLLPTFGVRFRF
jgi:hypothetical protein